MKDFNSDDHVEEWMAANGGVDGLRRAILRGTLAGQNKKLAEAWLHLHDLKTADQNAAEDRALLERSVTAAEQSAQAAQRSARWAMWASIVALVAALIAAVQFLYAH